jgi:cell wall-associated NlpC family hydrolase
MSQHRTVAAFIGRPFAYGARGPDAFDCWGLVLALRAALALPVPPDFASRELAARDYRQWFVRTLAAPHIVEARAGAIAYSAQGAHAGLFWAGRVVHAMYRAGVVAWPLGRWYAFFPDSEFYEWPPASSPS